MSVTLVTQEEVPCGSAMHVENVIKSFEAEVEMKEIQLNAARKRYVKALVNLEILTDGGLWNHSAKWLANEYGVPTDRIRRIREKVKRG